MATTKSECLPRFCEPGCRQPGCNVWNSLRYHKASIMYRYSNESLIFIGIVRITSHSVSVFVSFVSMPWSGSKATLSICSVLTLFTSFNHVFSTQSPLVPRPLQPLHLEFRRTRHPYGYKISNTHLFPCPTIKTWRPYFSSSGI